MQRGQRKRSPGAIPRSVVFAFGALTASYGAWLAVRPGGETVARWVDDLGLVVAASIGAGASIAAAVRRSGRTRRAWALMAAACLAWAIGEAIWSVYELLLGQETPFPSIADVFYLGGIPLSAAAMFSFSAVPQGHTQRARTVLDGLILGASMLMVGWNLVLHRVVQEGSEGAFTNTVALAYPVGDVATVAIVLFVASRIRIGSRAPLLLLGAGMGLQAFTDGAFAYLTATDSYHGGFIDLGWFAGYLLVGVAAFTQNRASDLPQAGRTHLGIAGALMPFGAVAVAMALAIPSYLNGTMDLFFFWNAIVLLALVLVRQVVTMVDNLTLARDLEKKVEERTAELRTSERRFRSLVQNASDLITVVDGSGAITYVSPSVSTVLGFRADDLVGEPLASLIHPDDASGIVALLADMRTRPVSAAARAEFRVRHAGATWRHTETIATSLIGDPAVEGVVLNSRDVTERKALEGELVRQALHDSLTGLANRALFQERIEHAIARQGRTDRTLAVVFFDLDGFKTVNDSYGHHYGDRLLVAIGERIRPLMRAGDTVARLGGDEFGLLLEDLRERDDAVEMTERWIAELAAPFHIDGKDIFVQASFGIAYWERGNQDADELLRNADVAMYMAKVGRAGLRVFDSALHATVLDRIELERDLRGAAERGELVLHYQPIVSLRSEKVKAFEALLRWRHPRRGMLPPDSFIPLAEESGSIVPIGRWVLREALHQAAEWQRRYPADPPVGISVNLSARQLQEPDVVTDVARLLDETGIPPRSVILEVTESVIVQDADGAIARLEELRKLGVHVAIDDFGAGYSALGYLKRLPADTLKIDRSFVTDVENHGDESEIARAIVRLSKTFRLRTVAEGIETPEQAHELALMGCDDGQGFHFARPMPAEAVESILAGRPVSTPAAAAG